MKFSKEIDDVEQKKVIFTIFKYLLIIICFMSIFGILLLIGYYSYPLIHHIKKSKDVIPINSMNDNDDGLSELKIYG